MAEPLSVARELTLKERVDGVEAKVGEKANELNELGAAVDVLRRRIEELELQVKGPELDAPERGQ